MNESVTIGFFNFDRAIPDRHTLEAAASQHPDLTLVLRACERDFKQARAIAREFAAIPVDIAIIFQRPYLWSSEITKPLFEKSIPVIGVDFFTRYGDSYAFYFGAHPHQTGLLIADVLGNWIQDAWNGQIDRVLITSSQWYMTAMRQTNVHTAADKLAERFGHDRQNRTLLQGKPERLVAAEAASKQLQRWPDDRRIAVIGYSDETALGVLDAARALGREKDIVMTGYGTTEAAREEMRRPDSPLIASIDEHLDEYGPRLIDMALRIISGARVPVSQLVEHTCVAASDVRR